MITVTLSMDTILRECSITPGDTTYFDKIKSANRKLLHDLFKLRKYNDDFIDTCVCYNPNCKGIVGNLQPSYDEFLTKLCSFLNVKVDGKIVDDDNLTKLLMERVEKLREISRISCKSSAETEVAIARALKDEFPVILHDVFEAQGSFMGIDMLYGEKSSPRKKAEEEEFYRCGLFRSAKRSVERQALLYERYVLGRKEYKEKIGKVTMNNLLKNNVDMNKLYMYVMHEYLSAAEKKTDVNTIKMYIGLVKRYLNSPLDKTVSITTDDYQDIDINNIKERLKQLELAIQDRQERVQWILIPEGKLPSQVSSSGSPRTTVINYQEIQRLKEIGKKKVDFYEKTPYLAKVIGLHRYRGYMGYIYPNGKVVLDRCFDENAPSSAKGDAIYIMNVELFESLSGLDKATLRKDDRVGIMIHNSTWENRLSKVINVKPTEETLTKANELVKRLKKSSR